MEQPLTYLRQRGSDHWLIGCDNYKFSNLVEQLFQDLVHRTQKGMLPKILLVERDQVRFLASFVAACAAGCPIFLGNPDWAQGEWQQVFDLVRPDLVWGTCAMPLNPREPQLQPGLGEAASQGWIMLPTGGSSGEMRFVIHTWETLMASVQGFKQYFQATQVNSFCVLPLYHVSGLMQFMRSFTSGGQLAILPFKALESGGGCDVDPAEFFLSLVPTQLQRLLESEGTAAPTWLSCWQTVLLGGAPAWPELLEKARYHRVRLAPTYGMTETASQIATLKPDAFLNGSNTCGQPLPHAEVTICNLTGELLGANETGIITIKTAALGLGYYSVGIPEASPLVCPQDLCFTDPENFQVDDLGFFDSQGYLNVVGRRSHKIITGGENVFPAEVESAIRDTQLVTDVCVIGMPDQYWGQVVTAIYVPSAPGLSTLALRAAIVDYLSKFKQPKYWIAVERLPRNSQGKVNHQQLKQIVMAWQQQPSIPDAE